MSNSAAHSMQPEIIGVGSGKVVGAFKSDDAILRFASVEEKPSGTFDLVSVELPFLWNFSPDNDIVRK